MDRPLVSIITPTFGRQAFLPAVASCVESQTYQNLEWLILDDSEMPSSDFAQSSAGKVRYMHSAERMTVGGKRNSLLQQAKGEIIVHFDDDDYYAPSYIETSLRFLHTNNLDIVLLKGFFVAHLNHNMFGYYRTLIKNGPAFAFQRLGIRAVNLSEINIPLIHFCYGWSYLYKKAVWNEIKFNELNTFEDREFVRTALKSFKSGAYEARSLECFHSVHDGSSSQCFPQFLIPDFVFQSLSSDAHAHYRRLKGLIRGDPGVRKMVKVAP